MKTITTGCVVVDLDGTLINTKHLLHLAKPESHDYLDFHKMAVYAPPVKWTLRVVRDWHAIGVPVVISTARSERYQVFTEEWLRKWFPGYTNLYMRQWNDTQEDHVTKLGLLQEIQYDYGTVLRAYDDNPGVLQMYRDNNIPTVTVRVGK